MDIIQNIKRRVNTSNSMVRLRLPSRLFKPLLLLLLLELPLDGAQRRDLVIAVRSGAYLIKREKEIKKRERERSQNVMFHFHSTSKKRTCLQVKIPVGVESLPWQSIQQHRKISQGDFLSLMKQ